MTANMDQELTFDIRDEYRRKPIAEKVISLLLSDISISPMMIDGGWGTGKTEFCHKTINLIREEHAESCIPVYINAFQADHADEPVMTLLAAIVELIPEDEKQPLIEKALPALRFGLKTTLKAGVSWILKQDAADIADDFSKDIKSAADEAVNAAVNSILSEHINSQTSIVALQDAVKKISHEKRLILFIDELDRCRPDFSVSILESIKHIFDVDGVLFILLANSSQLKASIKHRYGDFVDPSRYLDKFIKFSFSLPNHYVPLHQSERIHASVAHFNGLIEKHSSLSILAEDDYEYSFLPILIRHNSLSLRDVEALVRALEVYQILAGDASISKKTIYGYILLRVFGVYLACFHSDIATKMIAGEIDCQSILKIVGKQKLVNFDTERPDHVDFIAAVICLDANSIPGSFSVGDEEKIKVDAWLERYFQGSGRFGSRRRSSPILQAIEIVRFANR